MMKGVVGLAIAFLAIQIVRPARTNPPVNGAKTLEAHVDVPPVVDAILARACADCHSNATHWPWYSHVAPVSWLLANDVNGGRQHLNFSDWEARHHHEDSPFDEICKQVRGHDMPPWYYRPLHPDAQLTAADIETLCGWAATAKERSPGS